MARALQGSAAVLLACVLLLAIAAPSFVAGKQSVLSGNRCQRTFRNCARCTPGYKECAECEYGYELHALRKMCTEVLDGPRCTSTFRNCVKCNAAFKSCRECAFGFKPNAQGKCCEDLSGGQCRTLFPNCATCTRGFRACQACEGGSKRKGKTCERKTQQPEDLSGPECKALDANCVLCTSGFKSCAQCAIDYVTNTTTKKCAEDLSGPKCQSLFTNCATCTTGFKSCAQCANDYVIDATTKGCAEDLSGPKCYSLFSNCATCTTGFKSCAQCANDYVIDLAGVASIRFRCDSFDAATSVHMEVVDDAVAEELYFQTALFFDPQQRNPLSGIITVTVGDQQPRKDPTVTLAIPDAVAVTATIREEARLMYLNKWQSDNAILDTWEVTDERAGPVATVGSVTATLPLTAFYPSQSGKYVASLLLVTTNTSPDSGIRRRLLQAGVCGGGRLTRPVDAKWLIPPNSHYGPQNLNFTGASNFHRGVDFAAPTDTPVLAAIDGTVELRSMEPAESAGWGHYIIIRGAAGTTLYANLPWHAGKANFSHGYVVKAGDQIGVSGNSGTGSGPHLHFEYAPAGNIFDKSAKVDPEPCLDDPAVGSISVSIEGLPDDTFEVQLEGHFIRQISVGGFNTCTLGALPKGSYTLSVKCVVALDEYASLGVRILAPNMEIDGVSSLDTAITLGTTLTFTVTVT